MSNFAKVFAARGPAGYPDATACLNVRSAGGKADRVAANGRCKPALRPRPGAVSHPGNRAIAVSGRQPLPAPRTGNDESLFPFPRCKGRRNPDPPNGENETGYSTKTRPFFYGNQSPLRPFQHQRHRSGTQPRVLRPGPSV